MIDRHASAERYNARFEHLCRSCFSASPSPRFVFCFLVVQHEVLVLSLTSTPYFCITSPGPFDSPSFSRFLHLDLFTFHPILSPVRCL